MFCLSVNVFSCVSAREGRDWSLLSYPTLDKPKTKHSRPTLSACVLFQFHFVMDLSLLFETNPDPTILMLFVFFYSAHKTTLIKPVTTLKKSETTKKRIKKQKGTIFKLTFNFKSLSTFHLYLLIIMHSSVKANQKRI